VEVLDTLLDIVEIGRKLKKIEEQELGNQNIGSQIIDLKF